MKAEPRLRAVLILSAVFDFGALGLLLAMPDALFTVFDHPRPTDPFLFRLAALPLWMAPVVYLVAARALEDSLVRACVALRWWGAVGIAGIVIWHQPAGAVAYWSFVIADLLWGAAILLARGPRR